MSESHKEVLLDISRLTGTARTGNIIIQTVSLSNVRDGGAISAWSLKNTSFFNLNKTRQVYTSILPSPQLQDDVADLGVPKLRCFDKQMRCRTVRRWGSLTQLTPLHLLHHSIAQWWALKHIGHLQACKGIGFRPRPEMAKALALPRRLQQNHSMAICMLEFWTDLNGQERKRERERERETCVKISPIDVMSEQCPFF